MEAPPDTFPTKPSLSESERIRGQPLPQLHGPVSTRRAGEADSLMRDSLCSLGISSNEAPPSLEDIQTMGRPLSHDQVCWRPSKQQYETGSHWADGTRAGNSRLSFRSTTGGPAEKRPPDRDDARRGPAIIRLATTALAVPQIALFGVEPG